MTRRPAESLAGRRVLFRNPVVLSPSQSPSALRTPVTSLELATESVHATN
jgi:hypothetical protein